MRRTVSGTSVGRSRWLLRSALAAAGRGWPVFPLCPGSKYPAIAGWERRATCDPAQLACWWSRTPYNVGIACGPAGLVVVDLDPGRGQVPPTPWSGLRVEHGRDVLAVLTRRAGATPDETFSVDTASGGEHRYYLAPEGAVVRNTTGFLGWRVDTRAAGGMVVAAGSVRRVGGRPRYYTVVNPSPPVALPGWLRRALTAGAVTAQRPGPGRLVTAAGLVGHAEGYVRAAVDGEVHAVTSAVSGTRNSTLFTAAAALGELVGAGLVGEALVADALLRAASVHCGVSGFTRAEAERAVRNGLARGRARPRRISGLTD